MLGLIEAGCTDEQIASLLTNPDHAISEKPHEQGTAWLARDLARARDAYMERPFPRGSRMHRRTMRITVL